MNRSSPRNPKKPTIPARRRIWGPAGMICTPPHKVATRTQQQQKAKEPAQKPTAIKPDTP